MSASPSVANAVRTAAIASGRSIAVAAIALGLVKARGERGAGGAGGPPRRVRTDAIAVADRVPRGAVLLEDVFARREIQLRRVRVGARRRCRGAPAVQPRADGRRQ